MQNVKPFTTIDEQVNLLESRGVIISDKKSAQSVLLKDGFYRLINGYKDLFLDPIKTNDVCDFYKENIYFEHFVFLFNFDKALRALTFNYLLKAEANLRSAVVYAFCFYYRDHDAYLAAESYCSKNDYSKNKSSYLENRNKLIGKLQDAHDNKDHKKDYISHYLNKYGVVPFWVLANKLTFGTVSNFYSLLTPTVKRATANNLRKITNKDYVDTKDVMLSFDVLSSFRNICAHDERLYCTKVGKRNSYGFDFLLSCLGMSLTKEEMSSYCKALLGIIEIVEANDDLLKQVLAAMNIEKEDIFKHIIKASD